MIAATAPILAVRRTRSVRAAARPATPTGPVPTPSNAQNRSTDCPTRPGTSACGIIESSVAPTANHRAACSPSASPSARRSRSSSTRRRSIGDNTPRRWPPINGSNAALVESRSEIRAASARRYNSNSPASALRSAAVTSLALRPSSGLDLGGRASLGPAVPEHRLPRPRRLEERRCHREEVLTIGRLRSTNVVEPLMGRRQRRGRRRPR